LENKLNRDILENQDYLIYLGYTNQLELIDNLNPTIIANWLNTNDDLGDNKLTLMINQVSESTKLRNGPLTFEL
jgi:hypothetical protein